MIGFLNPELSGTYVFIGVTSAAIFCALNLGYGSWLRVGSLSMAIIAVPFLLVILAGRVQVWAWKRLLAQPDAGLTWLTLPGVFLKACLVAAIAWSLSATVGGELRAAKARQICKDCSPIIAGLENQKKTYGIYPTNAIAMVKANTILHRRYLFYYGQPSTNGIEWSADAIAGAGVSLFVTTNSFQFVVPIEKMSPMSFSSFYVYSYTSEHPFWNMTKLHWFLGGAFIDDPKQ